jgi:nucleotide-binding universal stress UspA family protein
MEFPFKKIGLAITFSPTGKALLLEAKRLQQLFNSELFLFHIGEKTDEKETALFQLISDSGLETNSFQLDWGSGDPAKAIIKKAKEHSLNLLIAGALEKETLINYYIGSVARKLMRKAPCSLLIHTIRPGGLSKFNKFCVSVDFSSENEKMIQLAYQFALLENAKEFVLIREFKVLGLASTVYETGSAQGTEKVRLEIQQEEEEKTKLYIKELQLKNINVETVCLYGKEGWEANQYIRENGGDIFVHLAPKHSLKFVDRLFQHDLEFIVKELPCSLLLIKLSSENKT